MSRQEMEQAALYYFGMDFIPSEQGTTAYDPGKRNFSSKASGREAASRFEKLVHWRWEENTIVLCYETYLDAS